MKFEVVGPDNHCKMYTTHSEAVPDEDTLKLLIKSGYKFRIDGRLHSKLSNLLAALESMPVDPPIQPNKQKKSIICIDTGEIFATQAQAARSRNIDPAAVSDSLKTGKRRAKLLFKFLED